MKRYLSPLRGRDSKHLHPHPDHPPNVAEIGFATLLWKTAKLEDSLHVPSVGTLSSISDGNIYRCVLGELGAEQRFLSSILRRQMGPKKSLWIAFNQGLEDESKDDCKCWIDQSLTIPNFREKSMSIGYVQSASCATSLIML